MSISGEVHDSLGILERLRSNVALTGAIFVLATGISFAMYYFCSYVPIIWYGPISTICFLAAIISGLLIVYSGIYSGIARLFMRNRIHRLAGDEKSTLARFLQKDSMTVAFLGSEPGPGSLIQAGIVYIEPNIGELARKDGAFWYTVKPWVFHYIKKHKHLIGLSG